MSLVMMLVSWVALQLGLTTICVVPMMHHWMMHSHWPWRIMLAIVAAAVMVVLLMVYHALMIMHVRNDH